MKKLVRRSIITFSAILLNDLKFNLEINKLFLLLQKIWVLYWFNTMQKCRNNAWCDDAPERKKKGIQNTIWSFFDPKPVITRKEYIFWWNVNMCLFLRNSSDDVLKLFLYFLYVTVHLFQTEYGTLTLLITLLSIKV